MVVVDLGSCPRCGSHLEVCEGNRRHQSCCLVCGFVVYHNPFPVVVATVIAADPPELRAGDTTPILWAIDTVGVQHSSETPILQ